MNARSVWILGLSMGLIAAPAATQGIVVDRGQFVVTVDGRIVGNEDFVIRRAGLGRGDAVFANGVVLLDVGGREQEVRPLLRAMTLNGIAASYQVTVTGPGAMELRLVRNRGRYVATISSGDRRRGSRVPGPIGDPSARTGCGPPLLLPTRSPGRSHGPRARAPWSTTGRPRRGSPRRRGHRSRSKRRPGPTSRVRLG